MAKLEITITDINWPSLTMSGRATDDNGQVRVIANKVKYDQAYTQFENDLHNVLRPLIETTIQRRTRR